MSSQKTKPFSLPLSNKEIRKGLKEDSHTAFHWLSQWCVWEKERQRFLAKMRKF